MSEATALKRTGAMALVCGGQVTKMTGGCVPAGLSSSMMIFEPFTRALPRVVDLDKAGSFPVYALSRRSHLLAGPTIVCGNPPVGFGCPGAAGRVETSPQGWKRRLMPMSAPSLELRSRQSSRQSETTRPP
jgi:hypothetical protein